MFEGKAPIGGSDFVVAAPPRGFGARFFANEEGVVGLVTVDDAKQGPPGHVHGGALTTLVDEAMGAAAWHAGYRVLAVNLNVNLRQAVPLNIEVRLEGKVERKEGRKVYTSGAILLPDGRVAVEATGVFVEAPGILGQVDANPFSASTDNA